MVPIILPLCSIAQNFYFVQFYGRKLIKVLKYLNFPIAYLNRNVSFCAIYKFNLKILLFFVSNCFSEYLDQLSTLLSFIENILQLIVQGYSFS